MEKSQSDYKWVSGVNKYVREFYENYYASKYGLDMARAELQALDDPDERRVMYLNRGEKMVALVSYVPPQSGDKGDDCMEVHTMEALTTDAAGGAVVYDDDCAETLSELVHLAVEEYGKKKLWFSHDADDLHWLSVLQRYAMPVTKVTTHCGGGGDAAARVCVEHAGPCKTIRKRVYRYAAESDGEDGSESERARDCEKQPEESAAPAPQLPPQTQTPPVLGPWSADANGRYAPPVFPPPVFPPHPYALQAAAQPPGGVPPLRYPQSLVQMAHTAPAGGRYRYGSGGRLESSSQRRAPPQVDRRNFSADSLSRNRVASGSRPTCCMSKFGFNMILDGRKTALVQVDHGQFKKLYVGDVLTVFSNRRDLRVECIVDAIHKDEQADIERIIDTVGAARVDPALSREALISHMETIHKKPEHAGKPLVGIVFHRCR